MDDSEQQQLLRNIIPPVPSATPQIITTIVEGRDAAYALRTLCAIIRHIASAPTTEPVNILIISDQGSQIAARLLNDIASVVIHAAGGGGDISDESITHRNREEIRIQIAGPAQNALTIRCVPWSEEHFRGSGFDWCILWGSPSSTLQRALYTVVLPVLIRRDSARLIWLAPGVATSPGIATSVFGNEHFTTAATHEEGITSLAFRV